MTSIPYDPTLALGQIVEREKLDDLMELAKAQQPLNLAQERLDNVLGTSHRLKAVESEMENIGVDEDSMATFHSEVDKMDAKIIAAALNYGQVATVVYTAVEEIMTRQSQKTISYSIESPINYTDSKITQFPLAFDSLEFDVSYVRNETNSQYSYAGAGQSGTSNSDRFSFGRILGGMGGSSADQRNTASAVNAQRQNHDVEGTIVITASATHKQADIIAPLIIDPVKAVSAWNYTYPDDVITTDIEGIMAAALAKAGGKNKEKKKSINIISGCSKSSSFVGFVHLLNKKSTRSRQSTSSRVDALKSSMESDLWLNAKSGGFGASKQMSNTRKSLNSSNYIHNHANLYCQGIIPSIVMNTIPTTIKKLAPDAAKIMEAQAAISNASAGNMNGELETTNENSKKGAQFMSLNSEFLKSAVSNLTETEEQQNKVIDINTMMTALENYMDKAMAGEAGIPTSFYLKPLTKQYIAKLYIRKFYPDGFIFKSSVDRTKAMVGAE